MSRSGSPSAGSGAGRFAFRDPEAPKLAKASPRLMVTPPTVSAPATAAAAVASGTGDTTNGSPTVANVATTTGAFVVGQDIAGPGIPANTIIKAISGTTITLGTRAGVNVNATATAVGVALTATLGTAFIWTHNAFRYLGAPEVVAGATFPDNGYGKPVPPSGANAGTHSAIEVDLDLQHYEIRTKGNGARFRIWEEEDGELKLVNSTITALANDGSQYRIHVDRGSRVRRRIRIEANSNFFFGGIYSAATAGLTPPPTPAGPLVVVAGDSFTEGTGSSWGPLGFALKTVLQAGYRNVLVSGLGSTGYLNDGTAGRMRLSARLQADVINNSPDIVVVCMGINDNGLNQVSLRTEVDLCLSMLKASPKPPLIIVTGPWTGKNSADAGVVAVRDTIKAAVTAAAPGYAVPGFAQGMVFVDNIAEAWQTGTGYIAGTVGDGANDVYTSSDTTHPTDAGHQNLADRLAPKIMAATT